MSTTRIDAESQTEATQTESEAFSGDVVVQAKKRAFIAAFRQEGVILHSYRKAGITSRTTVYDWLEADESFKRAFERAKEDFADDLEAELYRRVRDNTIKGKNDLALFCALKGNRREKFGDNLTVTPSEHTITFKVVRIEAPDYVNPEALEAPKQLRESTLT